MLKRVLTVIVWLPILLLIIYFGGVWLALGMAFLAGMSQYEYCRLLKHKSYKTPVYTLAVLNAALMLMLFYLPYFYLAYGFMFCFLFLIIWALGKNLPWDNLAALFWGIIYYSAGFGCIILLRQESLDFRYLFFAFLIAWATDSGAYFIGCSFGRHKLAPKISPKKSLEGAFGGVLCALIFVGAYGYFFLPENFLLVLGTIFLASLFSQGGDLLESSLKRWAGVKDSGIFFPGHGGVLDRFDSMMIIAPLVYILLILPY